MNQGDRGYDGFIGLIGPTGPMGITTYGESGDLGIRDLDPQGTARKCN